MKLYPKKLNNIADLRHEKRRLIMERREMDKNGLISLDDVLGAKKEKKVTDSTDAGAAASHNDGLRSVLGSLLAGGPLLELGLKLVSPLLHKVGNVAGGVGKKAGKNAFRWVTKEVLGGYLKWKAVELSYDGIKHIIESRKKKDNTDK